MLASRPLSMRVRHQVRGDMSLRASDNLTAGRELTPHQTRGQRTYSACPQPHHLERMGHHGLPPVGSSASAIEFRAELCVQTNRTRS